jgi:hypothetical protein
MSRSTESEDLSHGLTNCCNFYYVIVKIFIDCWQINDENRHFHSWNQTFTQMKPTTLTYQVKHFYPLIQSLSLKLTIYLVALVWISKESANWLRQYLNFQRLGQLIETIQSTRQLFLKEEGLNFQDRSSFVKHLGAANKFWYYGYHAHREKK